jgi:hypothetical protein
VQQLGWRSTCCTCACCRRDIVTVAGRCCTVSLDPMPIAQIMGPILHFRYTLFLAQHVHSAEAQVVLPASALMNACSPVLAT